jgi:hypothetical protein
MELKLKMALKRAANRAVSYILFGDSKRQAEAVQHLETFLEKLKQGMPPTVIPDESQQLEWWPSILPSANSEESYPMPKGGWVCFHCGERFTTIASAKLHFGATPKLTSACLIKEEEQDLLTALRKTEAERDAMKSLLENIQTFSLDELHAEAERLLGNKVKA